MLSAQTRQQIHYNQSKKRKQSRKYLTSLVLDKLQVQMLTEKKKKS